MARGVRGCLWAAHRGKGLRGAQLSATKGVSCGVPAMEIKWPKLGGWRASLPRNLLIMRTAWLETVSAIFGRAKLLRNQARTSKRVRNAFCGGGGAEPKTAPSDGWVGFSGFG